MGASLVGYATPHVAPGSERPGGRAGMADYVLVEKSEGVAILTLNRPEQLNAMTQQLSAELHDAVMRASAADEVGCIVITAAGTNAFPAGAGTHGHASDDRA